MLQITVEGSSPQVPSTSTNYLSPPRSATQQLQAALASHANTSNAPPSPPFVLPATTPPPALCHIPHPLMHPMFSAQNTSTPLPPAPPISTPAPPITMYLPVNASNTDSSYHFYVDTENTEHQTARERRARISLSHLSQSVSL